MAPAPHQPKIPVAPVHAAVADLVRRRAPRPNSIVVDVACGEGELAVPLGALGLGYLGVTTDPGAAERLGDRGVEAIVGELSTPGTLVAGLARSLGDRDVAAVVFGIADAGTHDVDALLAALRALCERAGEAPLVVSVPNVTHVDVGVRLLLGHWGPVRPPGAAPPRDGHASRLFSGDDLDATMARNGWEQLEVADIGEADGPRGTTATVALERGTPIGAQLAAIRTRAGPGAFVEHFVRAYVPRPHGPARDGARPGLAAEAPAPFLSVLLRTQGLRWATLQESLLSLAAQTCDDFEVLLLLHDTGPGVSAALRLLVDEFHPSFAGRVRILEVAGGGRSRPLNAGAAAAAGRYLASLDDDDLVFAHWVEELRDAEEAAPGHVLRVGVASQQVGAATGSWTEDGGYEVMSRPRLDYPLAFDYVAHLRDNLTPNNGYAVPRSLVRDLGHGWDESLPVLEDWDHLLRAASLCGVESRRTIAALLRVWVDANAENSKSAHPPEEWDAARHRILQARDAAPLLLGRGASSRLRALAITEADEADDKERRGAENQHLREELRRSAEENDRLSNELAVASAEIAEVRRELERSTSRLNELLASTSWRVTASARVLATAARRARKTVRTARELAREREGHHLPPS